MPGAFAGGVFVPECTMENPRLTEIFVVNDYVMSWLGAVGTLAALKRRATEGGSYRVRISLARLSLWLLQMGVFDKAYARASPAPKASMPIMHPNCSPPRRRAVSTRA
jgi:crotonobetainyl-CoA:carnitine CoA-transferase CaiB-like acyl-CoA transferase